MMEDSQTPKFPERVLVVLAHPDDESYGMGGTLAKLSKQGVRIILLCATRGESGIAGSIPAEAGVIRERELRDAAKHLGVEVEFLGYRDGELSTMDPSILFDYIAYWVDLVQPQVILTFGPDGVSGHLDHVTVSRIVTRVVDQILPDVSLLYISPSEATVLGCGVSTSKIKSDKPLIAVDISGYKVIKVRSIQCHASQNPALVGKPEDLVDQIPCYEYFTIARSGKDSFVLAAWSQVVPESERD